MSMGENKIIEREKGCRGFSTILHVCSVQICAMGRDKNKCEFAFVTKTNEHKQGSGRSFGPTHFLDFGTITSIENRVERIS
jgi:hypothetical protein